MRYALTTITLAGMLSLAAVAAQANNTTIENAIKSRPDLSQFYQAMVNTGVANELYEGVAYTVFAPTNAAFARIAPDKYPCFYSAQCKDEVAAIIRHHIVPGEAYVDTIVQHQGGVYSINHRFIAVAEPYKHDYTADGHDVLSEMMLGNGILYKIDGVIVNDYDLAEVAKPVYVQVAEGEKTTTTTKKTVVDKVCPPGEDCPDEVSTIVTRTTTTVVPPETEFVPSAR